MEKRFNVELGNDAELLAIFRDEVAQRSANLIEGSAAMMAGRLDTDRFSTLFRDAHTIKGSSRVMGFVEMGEAARVLEAAWRDISEGVLAPSPELGEVLKAVAAEFLGAMDEGTNGRPAGLQSAVTALSSFLGVADAPVPAPPVRTTPAPAPAEANPRPRLLRHLLDPFPKWRARSFSTSAGCCLRLNPAWLGRPHGLKQRGCTG